MRKEKKKLLIKEFVMRTLILNNVLEKTERKETTLMLELKELLMKTETIAAGLMDEEINEELLKVFAELMKDEEGE